MVIFLSSLSPPRQLSANLKFLSRSPKGQNGVNHELSIPAQT